MSSAGSSEEESDEVFTGVVTWFNSKLGFGFISSDDEEHDKIFVHKSAIVPYKANQRWRALRKGQKVEFFISETEKGVQAEEVTGPDGVPVKYFYKRRQSPSYQQPKKNGESERSQQPQDHKETKSGQKTEKPLTYPYFEQIVPKRLCTRKEDILHPTEWVGLRSDKIRFVQVAFPIIPPDGLENFKTISWKDLEYKVFLREDDYDGKIVSRKKLMKLEEITMTKWSTSSARGVDAGSGGEGLQEEASHEAGLQEASHEAIMPKPNTVEGQMWIDQADVDHEILQHLYQTCKESSSSKWFGTICFMAQQVAEKALKGGFLYLIGDRTNNFRRHYLKSFARALSSKLAMRAPTEESEEPEESDEGKNYSKLVELARNFNDYYSKTRYPDSWSPSVVPADQYSQEDATKTFESAEAIHTIVNKAIKR